MDETRSGRRAGRKRARTGAVKVAVSLVLLAAPRLPSAEALKLASISEDRRHLGVGLLRAVEVVRGRYERAWALVSASEPSTGDLDTALELLQANAKQWESLEPAVKLWTERDNEGPHEGEPTPSKHSSQGDRSSTSSEREANTTGGEAGSEAEEEGHNEERAGAPGVSDTTSRIYDEAASLLAHNRAVLGQALARSGRTSEGIVELEAACPEILEYQQNAQGRRDSKSWLHCYANLADMYKTQKRFEDASNLLARMPWLPSPQQAAPSTAAAETVEDSTTGKTPPSNPGNGNQIPAVPLAAASRGTGDTTTTTTAVDGTQISASKSSTNPEDDNGSSSPASEKEGTGPESSPPRDQQQHGGGKDESGGVDPVPSSAARGGEGARSEASPARGAGAARVAGLNKAAAAASAAAAAESAAAAAAAVETGAEAAARAVVERHAEAMRASMNELVGELAVTTATRPSASQDWLDSRVVAAEEVLAAVRAGLLAVAATSDQQPQQPKSGRNAVTEDVPPLPVGANGHADILREASHYLSAIKGVAGQGWAYVDNELNRMERHPAQIVKHGFQSRREVIHTFRYLLMKARQYASENQAQATPGSGSGSSQTSSRLRGKNRGRKASASSKAPRKGGGGARKQSPRSQQDDSSSKQSDGLLTLFVGAGVALLVAAVSSGRVGSSQGRRREVVRQRTATRAAKTVGRYVEPPQRGAVAALLLHLWGNLKRSGLMVSSQATSSASLMRTLLVTAWAAAFERLRSVLDRSRGDAAGGKTLSSSSSKKSASSGQGHHKQRSKKGGKKTSPPPHPPASLSREATASVTPPVSPPRNLRSSRADAPRNCADPPSVVAAAAKADVAAAAEAKADVGAAAAVVGSIEKRAAAKEATVSSKTKTTLSVDSVAGSALPATEVAAAERPADTFDTSSAGCGGVVGAVSDASTTDAVAPAVSVPATAAVVAPAVSGAGAAATAVELAAEMTAGVPFPDVMTAEQVQAMVEEDERAWEQARLSEKLQSKANAAAAAARPQLPCSASNGSGASKRAEAGLADAGAICGLANDGWSEVGGSGSRARGGGGGAGGAGGDGARGRVLSMRNVRAVARASRPSSPGSDPATTTSASSSECSEGSKDKPRHRHAVDGRGGGGGRGSAGGRATIATGKGAVPRAGNKSTWGGAVPASRGGANSTSASGGSGGGGGGRAHATRPPQGGGAASRAPTRDTEQAYPRTSRASYAPWATPSTQAPRMTGKPTQPASATTAVSASATVKGGSSPVVVSDSAKAAAPAKFPLRADRSPSNVLRQPLRAKVPVAGGKVAEVKSVEGGDAGAVSKMSPAVVVEVAAAPAPVAWTNTPSHPLGMKAEPAPLPPASEPPRPPPQHQQHWQRQQQREQQQRQQQQHHHQLQQQQQQHFFHQQDPHLLPMSVAPVHQQQHHQVGGHHYPPLSLPPHHHHHHNHHHHQPPPPPPPHEVIPPQFLPPSDEPFATPSAAAVAGHMPSTTVSHAPPPPPMVYTAQAHPAPLPTSSSTVSPRGAGDDVGDVTGNDNGGIAGGPTGETPHYHIVEGSYDDSPGMAGVADGGGQFSPDATTVIPPPQIVVLPSPQEQQQQGPFSPLAMLPSEDSVGGGGGSGGAPPVFGQGPPVGYSPTAAGGVGVGGGGDAAGEAFEALMGALCWQVEYYFSADNLVNDAYLRGLMDSEGFVAVSKIMVFNRVRCMTSDMSLLIAAMRRSTGLELRERDNSGEVRVRTIHSPLHWTKEQVPLPKAPSAVVAMEPEHVPYEAEEVAHEEKSLPLGDEGETVSCETIPCETAVSCEVAVSCEPAVSCETAVSCEPHQDGQEE